MTGSFTIKLGSTGGGSSAWGAITGTLSTQLDLQAALNAKVTAAGGSIANTVSLNANMLTALNTKVALTGDTMTGLLQFTGTTHAGLRLNNLTTVERDAIASPQAGMAIWNTTAARLQLHNGSAWTAGMVRLDGDTMTGALTIGVSSSLLLGTAGSAVGSIGFRNATSGTLTLAPPTGALGTITVTLPGVTSTLATLGANTFTGLQTLFGLSVQNGGTFELQNTFLANVANARFASAVYIGISSSSNNSALADIALYRDAAGIFSLRNPTTLTNPTVLRAYGTFTDASNYVRLALNTTSTTMGIACETAGTGADDIDLSLTPAGTGNVRFGTHSAVGAETVTGFITIKDSGGTSRKLAVIS